MHDNNIQTAKGQLDKVIKKARIHFYKPIQIAEILHRDRVYKDITLSHIDTYKNPSQLWRNEITKVLVARVSNSSAQYQHNLFDENALPPRLLSILGTENRLKDGIVEKYIYSRFCEIFSDVNSSLIYLEKSGQDFDVIRFIDSFRKKAGLRRSIDKVFEIIVYALFFELINHLKIIITIKSSAPDKLKEFEEFSKQVLGINHLQPTLSMPACVYRVGATNAADRGLDMYGNFGHAIQIKHLSLNEGKAHEIAHSIGADRIVIVCKEAEQTVILSLLNQIGWKSRIQCIVTEKQLAVWYKQCLKNNDTNLGQRILARLNDELRREFPSTKTNVFEDFMTKRGYVSLPDDDLWGQHGEV
jgi:type II restriction enzyme